MLTQCPYHCTFVPPPKLFIHSFIDFAFDKMCCTFDAIDEARSDGTRNIVAASKSHYILVHIGIQRMIFILFADWLCERRTNCVPLRECFYLLAVHTTIFGKVIYLQLRISAKRQTVLPKAAFHFTLVTLWAPHNSVHLIKFQVFVAAVVWKRESEREGQMHLTTATIQLMNLRAH